MKFEIYDDSLIVGRYAFTNVEYLYDVIDGVYDLRFDVIGANEGEEWNGNIMGGFFWDDFRKVVRSQPEHLHLYKGLTQKLLKKALAEFITSRNK
ncbi:hypothetical protein HER17_12780 [Pectobacterium carotovorum]|uniref:hypothetical protein n=1 Tax=Pectobacterium carotovorum TaxID=554 RepID=UPI0001A445A3|nr:hypothetical protein [Pectobacterium carotovorum]MDK9422056.1 hypothetical protein [Pectobacterium carotovorum]QLL93770.1 hypothetical protein HER17_12780 [Pectobacterium carotovorum]